MKKEQIKYLNWFCYAIAIGAVILAIFVGKLYTPDEAIETAIREAVKDNSVKVSTNLSNNIIKVKETENHEKKIGVLKWEEFSNVLPIFEKGILHTVEVRGNLAIAVIIDGNKDKDYYKSYRENLEKDGFKLTGENIFEKDGYKLIFSIINDDLKMEFTRP